MELRTIIFTFWGALCINLSLNAQSTDAGKSISGIKRDMGYLYAEATMKEHDEALFAAKSILEMRVSDWVREQNPSEEVEVCIAKAKEHTFDLQTMRGNYVRAFVYVKKSDIMPVTDKSEVVVFQVASTNTDAPMTGATSEETPMITEPAQPTFTLTKDEEEMRTISSFYDIEPYIKKLQRDGRVKAYGKYSDMPIEDCYIFIYDRQGRVPAVLKRIGDEQLNMNTLKNDNVTKYKNCGAIWLQLK